MKKNKFRPTLRCLPLVLGLVIAQLLTAPAQADTVQYIAHPEQALAARSEMIRSARKSIDLVYFIFEPCQDSTRLLMEELKQKAKSGVKVRLLMDAFLYKNDVKNNISAEFAASGMEIKFYNDSALITPGINLRSHIKFLLVDGKTYITGGRNMADDYYGLLDGINFIDRDILVTGASAQSVAASFHELWTSRNTSARPVAARKFVAWDQLCKEKQTKRLDQARAYVQEKAAKVLATAPRRECGKVQFLSDSPEFATNVNGTNNGRGQTEDYMNPERMRKKRVTKAFVDFVGSTQAKLEIENWSYIPFGQMDQQLSVLRERQVPIVVITNSAADSNGLLGQQEVYQNAAYAKRDTKGSQFVLQMALGGEMEDPYELTPAGSTFRLHGKVAVRDNKDSMVSSFNIDPRSYHTNLESMVIVRDCPAFAQDLQTEFHELRRIYADDIAHGHAASGEEAAVLTKVIGFFGLNFL